MNLKRIREMILMLLVLLIITSLFFYYMILRLDSIDYKITQISDQLQIDLVEIEFID